MGGSTEPSDHPRSATVYLWFLVFTYVYHCLVMLVFNVTQPNFIVFTYVDTCLPMFTPVY